MARILIGTSGWSYRSWRGPFFPMRLPAKRHLEYYASRFETAELNGVFYRTPPTEAVGRWHDETSQHFIFAWKASKFITHWKRLSENSINSPSASRGPAVNPRRQGGPRSLSAAAAFRGGCRTTGLIPCSSSQAPPVQFRIPPPELVLSKYSRPVVRSEHCTLHLRSP